MTIPKSLTLTPSTPMVKPLPKRRPTRVDEDAVEVKRIEGTLTDEEVDLVTEVLVEAFADDPFSLHLVGGNMDLNPTQLRSVVGAANVGGVIVVGLVPHSPSKRSGHPREEEEGTGGLMCRESGRQIEGEIAGVMIFHGPGQSLNSSKEQCEAGYNQFLEEVDEETRRWWLEYWNPLLARTCTSAFGEDTALHAWDLHLFGVRPAFHGKGVASKMMRFVQSLADLDGAPMTLQTQNEVNVHIYERKGFQVKEQIEMESRQGKSRFWFLLRKPELKEPTK
ncbi:hypothetical protein FA13DRAFT_1714625 [Coprinellus micaceus]|uniref:N-acetyltransferase domain-containing protein n=1 Tax=Coprinellus micaceus TaxID=71717 RepID=A0A4Y7SRF7_COPMI|nr:hypothetical protein FA13DRAFT_1714625 [Coprinellus micaceus]